MPEWKCRFEKPCDMEEPCKNMVSEGLDPAEACKHVTEYKTFRDGALRAIKEQGIEQWLIRNIWNVNMLVLNLQNEQRQKSISNITALLGLIRGLDAAVEAGDCESCPVKDICHDDAVNCQAKKVH